MKILFAPIHYFFGKNYGSEFICAYEIFTRILRLYPQTTAISLTKFDEEKENASLIYKRSISKPFYPNIFVNMQLIIFYTIQAFRLIKARGFNVVHHFFPFRIGRTFNPLFLVLGKNIKKIVGPVMVSVNFDNSGVGKFTVFDKLALLLDPFYSVLSRLTLLRADHIVALNKIAKEELISFGIHKNKITIIPFGIDIQKFKFTPYVKKDKTEFRLLAIGHLTKRKGTELVLQALEIVKKLYPNTCLTIVGDGVERQSLEEMADRLKLRRNVDFVGFVNYNELAKHYQSSHVLVSMSRAESWGQVYIDAMACGLPVIASKNDGSNEIVVDGEWGYLIDQEDYKGLAKKIIYLIRNPEIVSNLGRSARLKVERTYDWDKGIIPQYIKLYSS